MQEAVNIMKKVSNSSATVFIRGESGTGKELAARAIHYNSPRRSKPFTALNCACIPENLFESELFGYEPGAFTGAQSRKIGLFESTNNGTLFLDEIGDLPLMMQSKLLRVIHDKKIRRLGGKDVIKVDVRIITATNKDIEKEIVKGNFREELYYRLKVVTIELPALRNRKSDIPELSGFFMNKYSREFGKRIKEIDPTAINALTEYNWPGNIRQLESVIERAVIMCDTEAITLRDIKSELRYAEPEPSVEFGFDIPEGRLLDCKSALPNPLGVFDFDIPESGINFEELEKDLLKKSMARANGVMAKAAKLLGMSYKTFWYRWEKLNMEAPASKSEKQEQ
jgi:DNA-binding NtrC family response regulator